MREKIVGGFDPDPPVSPWTLLAYEQGMLGQEDMASVDSVTNPSSSGAEAELVRQAAINPRVAELLKNLGGLSGLRGQVDALLVEENGRL